MGNPTGNDVASALRRFHERMSDIVSRIRTGHDAALATANDIDDLLEDVWELESQRSNSDSPANADDGRACMAFAERATSIADECGFNLKHEIGEAADDLRGFATRGFRVLE